MNATTDPKYIVLEKAIATTDIETLGFSTNAVVFEVGFVITDFLPPKGVLFTEREMLDIHIDRRISDETSTFLAYTFNLSIVEQALLGRVIEPGAVKFHIDLYKKKGVNFISSAVSTEEGAAIKIHELYEKLKSMVKEFNLTEVWRNHPQFDSVRLESVFNSVGIKEMPWRYNQEFDAATNVLQYRKECKRKNLPDMSKDFKKGVDIHTGVGDCMYNLATISLSGCYVERGEGK